MKLATVIHWSLFILGCLLQGAVAVFYGLGAWALCLLSLLTFTGALAIEFGMKNETALNKEIDRLIERGDK